MKKTSRSFKFLIVSCIVFLCATIGFVLNVSLPNTFRVSAFTLGVKNSLSNSDVENFGDAVAAMNSQYPIEDNDLVFFHKEKNLTQNQDGDFIVNKQTFANLTNTSFEIISENATTNQMRSCAVDAYYLEELAAQNSYEVTHGENNIILTRKYATRRLVLETTNPNFDRCGAVAVANINNLYILQYASIEETKAAYEYYLNQSCINYVEVDIICWVEDEECKESEVMPAGLGDSYSYKTWGAEAMGVPAYSEYLRSLVDADNTDYDLPEVVVAVLDTGIDTDHPWFTDRLLYDGNGKIIGKDYTNVHPDEEYDFEDEHSHGTHCSGIICDMTLSNVKILPLKFMAKKSDGTSSGSGSGAISAMYYTMQLKEQGYNVVAINMSFSSKQNDNFYKDIIKYLYDADIMPVAASGNDGHDASNNSPANVKTSITVSAICRDLTLASFSNFGSLIDVCAPGVSINSANNDGGIVGKQGTSMAAPHV
ncbi:MAG: S8 family serine peptidase, partial [Clostridia bacterium]|nr:S8 family serine peptidase [Clostridia bacterium]